MSLVSMSAVAQDHLQQNLREISLSVWMQSGDSYIVKEREQPDLDKNKQQVFQGSESRSFCRIEGNRIIRLCLIQSLDLSMDTLGVDQQLLAHITIQIKRLTTIISS